MCNKRLRFSVFPSFPFFSLNMYQLRKPHQITGSISSADSRRWQALLLLSDEKTCQNDPFPEDKGWKEPPQILTSWTTHRDTQPCVYLTTVH